MSIDRDEGSVSPRYCPSCEQTFDFGDQCPEDGTSLVRLATVADTLIGTQLDGRYTIKSKLGAGGMGAVYRALQHSVGREVAIKVVNPQLISEPLLIKRFLRESKLTSRLSHPNAVAVLDFGQTPQGLFYLVMELLEGRTLSAVLDRDGTFAPSRAIAVGGQICDALIGAHRLDIVHRDLKPSNVIVLDGPPGRDLIKVLDFGLAKSLSQDTSTTTMTGSGAMLGTPAYMPPEAIQALPSDARSDLYSLGVILYQLVSGRLPFVADTITALLEKQASHRPPPLDSLGVPPVVAEVIHRLMAKNPAERYPDAATAQEALFAARDATPASLRPAMRAVKPADAASVAESFDETLPALAQPALAQPALAQAETLPGAGAAAMIASARPSVEKRRARWPLAVAAAIAVAGGAVALVLAMREPDPDRAPASPAPVTEPAPAPTPTPTAAEPEPPPPAPAPAAAIDAAPVAPAAADAAAATASPRARDRDRRRPPRRQDAGATRPGEEETVPF